MGAGLHEARCQDMMWGCRDPALHRMPPAWPEPDARAVVEPEPASLWLLAQRLQALPPPDPGTRLGATTTRSRPPASSPPIAPARRAPGSGPRSRRRSWISCRATRRPEQSSRRWSGRWHKASCWRRRRRRRWSSAERASLDAALQPCPRRHLLQRILAMRGFGAAIRSSRGRPGGCCGCRRHRSRPGPDHRRSRCSGRPARWRRSS